VILTEMSNRDFTICRRDPETRLYSGESWSRGYIVWLSAKCDFWCRICYWICRLHVTHHLLLCSNWKKVQTLIA